MRHTRLVAAAVVLASSATGVAQVPGTPTVITVDPTVATCRADDTPCRDWLRFRRLTTGPYQSFAIATHQNRATVIISESSARRSDFLAVVDAAFGSDVAARSYRRWTTGLDGWLEDIVLDVRLRSQRTSRVLSGHDLTPWNAPADIVDRLLFIYAGIYGTTDGFWVDNVNAFRETGLPPAIAEPTVVAADLLDWLVDQNQTWTDVATGVSGASFRAVQDRREPAVYARADKTLILLVVPPKIQLAALAGTFRRFAVASDLLVGAYQAKSGATILAARARQLPFIALPPLRFETLASFVRTRTVELMQSYERRRIFAGRVRSGPFAGWDWAPILLSSQLDDSEFGTLLNQADQILKSWSQAGEVDYYSFDHPQPESFPFEDESASDYFARRLGTTSLVFNWNTQAFSTIHQIDQGELISIDRFGALPVLYLPSGSILDRLQGGGSDALRRLLGDARSKAQDVSRIAAADARDFFAERGDPILVRVTQNVLLYQIAQAFLGTVVAPAGSKEPARWEVVSRILREEAAAWLRSVAAPGPTPGMSPSAEAALERAIRTSNLTIDQLAETIATPQVTWSRFAGVSARYQRQAVRLAELAARHDVAADAYREAFTAFCTAVHGTMRPTIAVPGSTSGGRTCDYTVTNDWSAATQQARLSAAEGTMKALRADYDAADKTLDGTLAELEALSESSDRADELAKLVAGEAAITAQLDRILAKVRAGVAGEAQGAIRTPALVLSKNTQDEDAIGGHNITFDPTRVRVGSPIVAPGGRGRGSMPVTAPRPTLRARLDAPGMEPVAALKATRSGSLLDEMRTAQAAGLDPALAPRLARDAAACSCDVVVRTPEGDVLFARPGPPPVQRRLVGTTGIVEALAGPPRATTVRFDGFGETPDLVESIVRSTQLARDAAVSESTRLSRLAESARQLFGIAETPARSGSPTLFSFLRRGGQSETLRVSGVAPDLVGPLLNRRLPWRTATVAPGRVTTLENGGSATSTVVRFGPGTAQPTLSSIDVEVQMSRGRPAIAPQNLASTAKISLAGMGPGSSALAEGLAALRSAIRNQLNPTEINFLVNTGATPPRISDRRRAGAESRGE